MLVHSVDTSRRSGSSVSDTPGTGTAVQVLPPALAETHAAAFPLVDGLAAAAAAAGDPTAHEPAFAVPETPARAQLRQLWETQVPPPPHLPHVRYPLMLFQNALYNATVPPASGGIDYRAKQILELPGTLVRIVGALHVDAQMLQRKEAHLQGRHLSRAGRKGAHVVHAIDRTTAAEQAAGMEYMFQVGQHAMLRCLPAVTEVLRELNEPDLAEYVAECLALLQACDRQRGGDQPFAPSDGVLAALVARSVDGVITRLSRPPAWIPPPAADSPAATEPQRWAGQAARLQWLSAGLETLRNYGDNHSVGAASTWICDAMNSLRGVLDTLIRFERDVWKQVPSAERMRRLARAQREFHSAARDQRRNVSGEEIARVPFETWCENMDLLFDWMLEPALHPDPAVRQENPAEPSSPSQRTAVRHPPAATPPDTADEPATSRQSRESRQSRRPKRPAATGPSVSVPPQPLLRRPSLAAVTAAAVVRPAWRTLSLADAIVRLDEAADADPAAADAALREFLGGRRIRHLLHGVPPPQAAALLETLARLVDRCGPRQPGLGFFPQRDLLDAAWSSPDSAARGRLVDSVLAHFAAGPRPAENPAAFRAFCLGGGLEKLFQVLPAADPARALGALQALERRLTLQDREDDHARRSGLSVLGGDLRKAIQQRRMAYMASRTALTTAEREASAGDMRAWLAGALHAVAPHVGDPGVQRLARRLAVLCGLEPNVVPRRPDAAGLRQAALRLLTGADSASCEIDTVRRRVSINAHNLDTPVFEALLQELAGRTLASGGAAFTAFELRVGGEHDDDAGPLSRKRPAVARWLATLPPSWRAQHQGGGELYLHAGDRPRAEWATWNPAAGAPSS